MKSSSVHISEIDDLCSGVTRQTLQRDMNGLIELNLVRITGSPVNRTMNSSNSIATYHVRVSRQIATQIATWPLSDSGLRSGYKRHPNGNRTHVRGTSIAGFSVCSRLFNLAPRSVSWRPSSRPARKILTTAFGRDGDPAHLTSSLSDRRAEPRERRGYLRSQSVVVIGSCDCLHPDTSGWASTRYRQPDLFPVETWTPPDSTVEEFYHPAPRARLRFRLRAR